MRFLTGMLCVATTLSAAEATSDQVREAATRAIALLQSSQKDWYAKQSCESCHHQILPAIAFRVAREHGLAVNETIARDNDVHAFSPFANLDRAVQYYAASIDYGDSAMVDLLVKSGAKRDAKSKDGLTASELAKKYEHVHMLKTL
jgi:hypothetical protein